jgi:uncharacterized protein Smg (DUF494 family)
MLKIEEDITKDLTTLEYSDKDRQPKQIIDKLPKDLKKLKYKKEQLDNNLKLLEKLDKTQYNKTDSDASLMIKPAHNLMAYNSQVVI